jgi:hypothetical protein
MKTALFALSTLMLVTGTSGAFAAARCQGDFQNVGGGWVADPTCERGVAQAIAGREDLRISRHPMGIHQISREEFCLGNEDIRTDVYCAPYKD